ncbi:hypothetical protein [Tepidimonas charontis]|nr:hypothetical protein [Tepidimonas charontis]
MLANAPGDAISRALAFSGATNPTAWQTGVTLRGPTGQQDIYRLRPRQRVLCVGPDPATRDAMVAWARTHGATALPCPTDGVPSAPAAEVALFSGDARALLQLQAALAERPGAVVPAYRWDGNATPLLPIVVERSISVNTAAAGGNASLMALD